MSLHKVIIVRQVRSLIRKNKRNLLYLKSLGLGKIGREKTLKVTPEVLGLLKKANHLITYTETTHEA